MKLKLTYSQFTALYKLLNAVCTGINPKGIEAHVLHGVLFRIYKKFYIKAIKVKKKYTVSIESDEACAFLMFFGKFDLWEQDVQTINLVRQINNDVTQKYAA